nr:Unknown Function [uncultured bacterium]APO28877.1 Unknown Function [uncultured bacterium]APO30295.1 Unknown Function [uncultured bacterium]APO30924.1 Unknown Function [uncultured bacterium]APO32236.1 Unknown Function [uncultured bacterium]
MDNFDSSAPVNNSEQGAEVTKPKPKKPSSKRKPPKQNIRMSVSALQELFSSIIATSPEEKNEAQGRLDGREAVYLANESEIYAVLMTPACYDKLLRD